MGAPKGNQYWKIRSKDGRDKKYTPDKLLEVANEYFQWCIDNPLEEQVLFHSQGVVTKDVATKMRPFSLQGFCNYSDIKLQTFLNYEKEKDFFDVTTRIRGVVENQQFEGAAAGFLNPNIIARKLGLVDKKDVTTQGDKLNSDFKVEIVPPKED